MVKELLQAKVKEVGLRCRKLHSHWFHNLCRYFFHLPRYVEKNQMIWK